MYFLFISLKRITELYKRYLHVLLDPGWEGEAVCAGDVMADPRHAAAVRARGRAEVWPPGGR